MNQLVYRKLFILSFALVLLSNGSVHAADRFSLVIGNANYVDEAVLGNTLNDAHDVASKLRKLGFDVTSLENAGARQMRRAVNRYLADIRGRSGISVIYYSGHGVQDNNRSNYLLPVDAQIEREADIPAEGIPVNQMLANLEQRPDSAVSLVVLDACRNNPFSTHTRGSQRGLARVGTPPGGTLVLYAASPGQTADDNPDERNGLFTQHFLNQLDRPGLDIEDAFERVALAVKSDSAGRQVPYKEGNLLGRHYLAGKANQSSLSVSTQPVGASASQVVAIEQRFWDSTERCGSIACYEAYLREYPAGRFAALAKVQMDTPSEAPSSHVECCRLTVKATPSNARIRIMNIGPQYRDGMRLDPGSYRVRVDRDGYEPYDKWVSLEATDQVVMVDLQKAMTTSSPVVSYVAPPTPASSSNAEYSSAINLKAPDIAENGCVVPVTIDAPSLSASQISIYSGSRSNLAMRADLVGASTTAFASTRIKMRETSPVIVDILTRGGKLLTSRRTLKVTIGCQPSSRSGDGRPSIKVRGKNGTLKMLLSQPMFTNDHLDTLSISADGRSMVNAKITAWASKNPYFSFKTDNRTSKYSVKARSTTGQSASKSTR